METLVLKIEGMTCSHCEMTVSKAIRSVSGVKDVDVSHETNSAKITARKGKVKIEKLIEIVESIGYKASV
jgi:copper chaperone CopZ